MKSLLALVFIIAVHTGEVLHYEAKCKHWDKESNWYKHEENCAINHITCAEPMKKEVAIKMFLRSIKIIGLNYRNKCLGWGFIFFRWGTLQAETLKANGKCFKKF